MGGDAMFKAMRRTRASHSTLLVLLAIASWADEHGLCSASLRQIQQAARLGSKQTVLDAIADLVERGELAVLPRGYNSADPVKDRKRRGGFQARNYYQVKVVHPVDHLSQLTEGSKVVQLPDHQGGPIRGPKVVQSADPTPLSMQVRSCKSGNHRATRGAATPSDVDFVQLYSSHVLDLADQQPRLTEAELLKELGAIGKRLGWPRSPELFASAIERARERRQGAKKVSA